MVHAKEIVPVNQPLLRTLYTVALAILTLATACCGKQTAVPAAATGQSTVQETTTRVGSATQLPQAVSATATLGAGATRPAGRGLYQLPHVTLIAVTDWQATLKPCGCTMDLKRGGVERIGKWVADLRQQDDSVLMVHAGSFLYDPEAKASAAQQMQLTLRTGAFAKALSQLQFAAVAVSRWDLAEGGEATRKAYETVAAQVLSLGGDGNPANNKPYWLTKTKSGVAVGIIGVDALPTGPDAVQQAVGAQVQLLRGQGAQIVVALSNLGLRGSRKLARNVQGLDVVVVGQLEEKIEPLLDMEREGQTLLVHATRHGAWFAALTLVPDGGGSWRDASEFLPGEAAQLQGRLDALHHHIADAKARGGASIEQALPYYDAQVQDLQKRISAAKAAQGQALPAGRLAAYRAVGLDWTAAVDTQIAAIVQAYDKAAADSATVLAAKPLPLPAGQPGYMGQEVCLDCHTATEQFALHNPHAHAWATLVKENKTRDLDCVPCHVTGWGKPGGSAFENLSKYENVQCEACHGPASLHVASMKGQFPGSAPIKPPKVTETVCLGCHTPEHAPRFAWAPYHKRLLMPGHGLPVGGQR